MSSIQRAFRFAVERLAPSVRPTGTLSLYATFSGPLNAEGATAEAALAIGFLALLKGDHLKQDITITGTLEGDGRIGQVAQVAENDGGGEGWLPRTAGAARAVLCPASQSSQPEPRIECVGA